MIHIGVDQHKRFSQVVVVDQEGGLLDERRLYHHDKQEMRDYFSQWSEQKVAVLEATRNWYWLYELLEETTDRAKLSHPAKTRLIAESKVKTDRIDGRVLAELSRSGFLPEAYIPSRDVRDRRELHRFRVVLVALGTRLKNRVHAILDKLGIEHPWSDLFGKQGRQFLDGLKLRRPYQLELSSCLRLLDAISEEVRVFQKEIRKTLSADARSELLMGVPGIAEVFAYLILYEIGQIERFPSAKHFASYCALTPQTRQSAEHFWQGHTDRRGNLYLKWAFTEAAHVAIHKDPALEALYQKHRRTKGAGKAILVVARKLAVAVYYVLKKGQNYRYNYLTKRHLGKPVRASGR